MSHFTRKCCRMGLTCLRRVAQAYFEKACHTTDYLPPIIILTLLVSGLTTAHSAVVYVETFDSNDSGWSAVSDFTDPIYRGDFGNLAGCIQGDLPDQFLPLPRNGGFLADSGASAGAFTGNYTTLADFEGWSFDLFSEDEIPLSLQVIIVPQSGSTFTYSATVPQGVGSWSQVGISGTYSDSWTGGDADAFAATLADVSEIKILLQDATDAPVSFYIDNFSNDHHPAAAVPEPQSLLLLTSGVLIACTVRWRRRFLREHALEFDPSLQEADYADL